MNKRIGRLFSLPGFFINTNLLSDNFGEKPVKYIYSIPYASL